ncbi:hypothetical protein KUTeg_007313 [Tegillarca granosa]|uniref:Apolipoprotein D n=1 Tax=Tegillarca granosa TaxID=220873 RepID=A0ABQ9FHH4_TEGGR|nr:hypothetical protein KUTeg_007313 [Tegillarca granosa]
MILFWSAMGAKLQILSIFIFVIFNVVAGQVLKWGRCPNIPVQPNFDVNSYMGEWYEYQRFFAIFELGVKCAKADYSIIDESTVRVVNTGFNKWTGKTSIANGTATISDPAVPAKLKVKFSRFQPAGNYWVLDTDYNTYSLVYSCQDLYIAHSEITWILTRDRAGISDDTTNRLYSRLQEYGINPENFRPTDQTGCPQA